MDGLRVEYSHNNSGGRWWLTTNHWKKLEKAGWKVAWREEFLGALATEAEREGLTLREAVDEWENVTGLSSTDAGCACCGQPHHFTAYRGDKWLESGPNNHYEVSW